MEEKKCLRCGRCCLWATFSLKGEADNDRQEIKRWLEGHHCVSVLYPEKDGKMTMGVRIPLICQYLKCKDGVYSCKIYETRPVICKEYFCQRAK